MRNIIVIINLLFLQYPAYACLRSDIEDRPKEEVLEKSISLAKTFQYADVTGSVIIDGSYISTGIALDPFTVLTAAHNVRSYKIGILFKLDSDGWLKDEEGGKSIYLLHGKPILHPDSRISKKRICDWCPREGQLFMNEVSYDGIESKDLPELFAMGLWGIENTEGVDLAILKLSMPLSPHLKYPRLPSGPKEEISSEGIVMGYGSLMYNNSDAPSIHVWPEQDIYPRHLFSTQIKQGIFDGLPRLYGSYRGKLVNGQFSYITNPDMKKMEAIPVGGDSGGPLLIKRKGDKDYILRGIVSGITSFSANPKDAKVWQVWKEKTQGIFPAYTDIAYQVEWIRKNMGPVFH